MDTFAQQIARVQELLNTHPEIGMAVGGFGLGVVVASLFALFSRQKLLARALAAEARVEAQHEALEQAGEVLDERFRAAAQDALLKSNEQFLQLARERLGAQQQTSSQDLEKRQKAIAELLNPVNEHLKALSGAIEQVKGTDIALREDLKNLGRETAKLVGALRDPSAQGLWGEFILEGVLDKSGLIKGVHYETQVTITSETGKQRPDAVIRMQDGFSIIVDAKAPVNEFAQRFSDELSEEEAQELMSGLARQVREHVKALGAKTYWENIDSADFTVMFLPSEHLYSMALRADPSLVDFAAQKNVVIASPTLLMSLLRVVSLSWRQVELAENAKVISERGLDLYRRILTFSGHMEKVGKGLKNAMDGYNSAIGSLERAVLPAARKFKDLQKQAHGDELPVFEPQEDNIRHFTLAAEDEQEKKRA
ncbi:MAG: DNA recombination protein RmuC [Alphaproteobacteria bacterium]|nr:DNA recombination protein RmuC [Alphaproteobacteria bacterium]MCB9975787.1 DNA recombination protein RmuC [Rhodospirillales bacterium]